MSEAAVKREVEMNAQRSTGDGAQVYLRFVGTRFGERFVSPGIGPWGARIDGSAIVMEGRDILEVERLRSGLEEYSHVTDLHLEVAEITRGKTASFRPMSVAADPTDKSAEDAGVCRRQCQTGGSCSRKICTGAASLPEHNGVAAALRDIAGGGVASLPHPESGAAAALSPAVAERKAVELLGLIKLLPETHQQRVCVTVASNLARRLRCVAVEFEVAGVEREEVPHA